MQLNTREASLLMAWKRQLEYDNRRLAKATTRFRFKRKALNNERIRLIDRLLKEADYGKTGKE